jgi:hypothetical protein
VARGRLVLQTLAPVDLDALHRRLLYTFRERVLSTLKTEPS